MWLRGVGERKAAAAAASAPFRAGGGDEAAGAGADGADLEPPSEMRFDMCMIFYVSEWCTYIRRRR